MVMKCTKKILMLWFLLIFLLSGCGRKFDPDDYLGKTSTEIIEEYGEFDYVVGDIAYNSLRLKGFYDSKNKKAKKA